MKFHSHCLMLICLMINGQFSVDAADMGETRQLIYKTVDDVKLKLYIFEPAGHTSKMKRPAIVFFFGGGWRSGNPQQFRKQCEYLASRGMVAMTADYRVSSRHQVKGVSCVRDAKSAIRWVRTNAGELGINPQRIVAAGGSAGGHLAACTGTISQFDELQEDAKISSRPNAMVLFNPAVVIAPVPEKPDFLKTKNLDARMGMDAAKLSPYHHLAKGVAPTLILHGEADLIVPYWTVESYTESMQKLGNRCRLVGYKNQGHGFFNWRRNQNKNFIATTTETDLFLVSLGFLEGEPAVEKFFK